VRNSGDRDGADVVQVYAALPGADAPERLVGFARVEVAAGASSPFSIRIPVARLATRDPDAHAWRPARGSHTVTVARHADDPAAVAVDVRLPGEPSEPSDDRPATRRS
jgi:beta-glucosidase